MEITNQEEKLRQEILNDALLKADRLIARAQNQAEKILRDTKQEIKERREARLQEVSADANAAKSAMLQEVEQQLRANWLVRREQAISDFLNLAKEHCETMIGKEQENSYRCLCLEAMKALGPGKYQVEFPAACQKFLTVPWLKKAAAELFGKGAEQVAFTLSPTGKPGVRFLMDNGRMVFDNTYAARLAGMREQLRTLISTEA